MKEDLISLLFCPACHGELRWRIAESSLDHIEQAEARCCDCSAMYPVQEGIGLFLTSHLPRHDLWEKAESGLTAYLRKNPETKRRLLDVPLGDLGPAQCLRPAGHQALLPAEVRSQEWAALFLPVHSPVPQQLQHLQRALVLILDKTPIGINRTSD